MLCCGSSEGDWDRVVEISQKYDSVIPAFGVHPWYTGEVSGKWLTNLENILKEVPGSAVGEIGLDHTISQRNDLVQKEIFIAQLKLAEKLQRPVSIHCRKAWGDLIECLRMVPVRYGGAIHSYSGPAQLVSQLQNLGLSISFSGSITNEKNRKAREALQCVDPSRLLIETDSPDIVPFQLKGINEPANLIVIAQTIAQLKEQKCDATADLTTKNCEKLFKKW